MSECIFCKIASGEIPSYKIYEDDLSYAFLDIDPINIGHTLVIPKKHVPYFKDLDVELLQHLVTIAQKVSQSIDKVFEPTRVGLIVEGFDLDHFHFKVTSLDKPSDLQTKKTKLSEDEFRNITKQLTDALQSSTD